MQSGFTSTVKSLEEMEFFARDVASSVRPGMTIGLCGPLGAGKTTFVRFLSRALGSSDAVSSPTYVLEQRYALPQGGFIEHWDLYRLRSAPDELLSKIHSTNVRLVEWSDKFLELKEQEDITITFDLKVVNDEVHGRTIEISKMK